jgi:hypothetical protein
MVPLAANQALGIAIVSYDGQLNFGLNADYDALADVELLAHDLIDSIAELGDAAGLGPIVGDAAASAVDASAGGGTVPSRRRGPTAPKPN